MTSIEDGAGMWVRADQAVEHRLSGGQRVVVRRFFYQGGSVKILNR
jgi:hypothetical protein